VCFSRGFLPRFRHLLHISSHPMIFFVSFVILLSLCAFRILEYLLGYFLEILCMKILFCLCAGLIFYALWIAALLIFLFGIHLTAVLNTTLFLELTGSNGIFGSISGWFWFRNMTSSGTQHNVWGKLTILEVGCSISKSLGIWYLEDLCSSLLGHLQTFLYSPIVLDFRKFLSVDIITLFTLVLLRHWGGVIVAWFFSLLSSTLCPFVTKRGSNFWFGSGMYF
jgi:hypothetical protein